MATRSGARTPAVAAVGGRSSTGRDAVDHGAADRGAVDHGAADRGAAESACCGSVMGAPLSDTDAHELAAGFAALADPVRLKLLSLLASAEAGEVCVCDLTAPVGKTQGTVSHHLKVLADAGLVVGQRRGKWVWYSVVAGRLEVLRAALVSA